MAGLKFHKVKSLPTASTSLTGNIYFNETDKTINICTGSGWSTYKGTDTNTWRGIVDNLTSDSATDSLSAKQGKALYTALQGKMGYGSVVQNTNPFGGKKLYINTIDNALSFANKRYWVTATIHKKVINGVTYPKAINAGDITKIQWEDSPVVSDVSSSAGVLFNNCYEDGIDVPSDSYLKVHIDFNADGTADYSGYPYGTLYLSYYYVGTPEKALYRTYNTYKAHTVGYKQAQFNDYIGTNTSSGYIQSLTDMGNYGRRFHEFVIFGRSSSSYTTRLTQIEWELERPSFSTTTPLLTNYGTNYCYQHFFVGDKNNITKIHLDPDNGNISCSSLTVGGTSAQFLKADGSVDSNTYSKSGHTHAKSQITDFPSSLPANGGNADRAKFLETFQQNSTTNTYGSQYPIWAQWSDATNVRLQCTNYTVWTDNATYATTAGSAPASDVYSWAKASTKPTYNATEVKLTEYSKASSYSAIAASDTVNQAIGKLEGAISGLETLLASI